MRDATDAETPRTAAALVKLASAAGWTTRTTYAENGAQSSVVVRLQHPAGHRAAAVWTDGKADGCWLVAFGLGAVHLKLAQLRVAIA